MNTEAKTYRLLGPEGFYASAVKGTLGGNGAPRGERIYGRLDCRAAKNALAAGYAKHRVFFADESTALAAGYRPCNTCMHERYTRSQEGAPLPAGPLGIGPQHEGEPPFTARMRLHQSWYRAVRLGEPYGVGPSVSSTNLYGNMLVEHAARAGRNFLTPGIHAVAMNRIAASGGVEKFRCLHNMLSSQPMCFNLFGPLVEDHELATRLLEALLPGEVARVTDVRIEFAPTPKRDYLGDNTSFDAFIEYERVQGGLGFLGIETKLTEPFSIDNPSDPSKYLAQARRSPGVWPERNHAGLPDRRWYQLWRNHLLVEALRLKEPGKYAAASCVVVRHPADEGCSGAIKGYRELLGDTASALRDWPIDFIVAGWTPLVRDAEAAWLEELEVRYLDLSRSEAAGQRSRAS